MVSVLLPTTGRPDRAAACVRRLLQTTTHWRDDLEIVAAVDADETTRDRLLDLGCVVDYSTELRGNAAWNAALAMAIGDPIVFAADDLSWQPGWLDAALAALVEHPDSMIGFNDGHFGPEQGFASHYLAPRSFIKEVLGGRVAWEYPHSFNDAEASARAIRAGRFHWCGDAVVIHEHWLFGTRPMDETDKRNVDRYGEAEALFEARKAAGFPDDLPSVL